MVGMVCFFFFDPVRFGFLGQLAVFVALIGCQWNKNRSIEIRPTLEIRAIVQVFLQSLHTPQADKPKPIISIQHIDSVSSNCGCSTISHPGNPT